VFLYLLFILFFYKDLHQPFLDLSFQSIMWRLNKLLNH